MVDTFRLRLDIGSCIFLEDVQQHSSSSTEVNKTKRSCSVDCNKHIIPEFVIPYTENNTFADVLRYTIEKERLGGHLLELLQAQNDGRRDELYVLLYSKKDATLIQPYWNRIRQQAVKGNITRLKLQLSVGDEVIKYQNLVHEFINDHRVKNNNTSKHDKKSTTMRERDDSSNSDNILCVDMKLIVKKIRISYKPKPDKICIMLCEEHWKYQNIMLSCNVLYHAPNRRILLTRRIITEQRHRKLLKSFLINDFIKNKQLLAIAFLVPTSELIVSLSCS